MIRLKAILLCGVIALASSGCHALNPAAYLGETPVVEIGGGHTWLGGWVNMKATSKFVGRAKGIKKDPTTGVFEAKELSVDVDPASVWDKRLQMANMLPTLFDAAGTQYERMIRASGDASAANIDAIWGPLNNITKGLNLLKPAENKTPPTPNKPADAKTTRAETIPKEWTVAIDSDRARQIQLDRERQWREEQW
ncbi:MAG: hypothetical protein MI923_20390 [Phycisphaerales bacterium]|nr:hypothetical protein [Phycisphaerales bacterium]